MIIRCEIEHMAENDVRAMLEPGTIEKIIEGGDKKPLFKVFSIGHEGSVIGNLVGIGNIQIQYFRDAIKKIVDNLAHGTKCFFGHAKDNNTSHREPIGEVVAKKLEEIGGVLHDLAVVYVYPSHASKVLDVASIETTVGISADDYGGAYVTDVGEVTAVALGDGRIEKPGFPGATLLAQLQAFQKGDHSMTLAELKAAIKEGKYSPSDIFSTEDLGTDKNVRSLVESALEDEKKATDRANKQLEKAKLSHAEELKARDEQLGTLKQQVARHKVGPVLSDLLKEMKVDERMAKAIELRAKSSDIQVSEDTLKEDVRKYIEAELTVLKPLAEVLGSKPDVDRGGYPSDKGPQRVFGGNEDDFSDPKNNPLIPTE